MKAVLCTHYAGPDELELADIDSPRAGPGEVVIGVKAAGLNFFDTLIIENKYQFKPELPFSPGAEVAGEVLRAGEGVTAFKPGDRVMAYTVWGGAREEVAVPEASVIAMPHGLDFTIAAGLIVTYGTSLHALRDRAGLQPGETLAVLGASGGVGQAAVEIGKAMGARVIACASSDDKLEFCRSLGADETINYSSEDLKTRLKDLTGGSGVDVIYDPVGAELAEAAFRAIGWKGRFLVIGFAGGAIPKMPLNLALLKGADIVGVFWGDHLKREPELHQANMKQLLDWVLEGKVKPHVHKVYPLGQTAQALQAIARREVLGKVIVTP
ncbi:MAG: NADPH:quinone oxidoreductase family protein [Anderseniella sp.]|jgi:NADPH2:quinone reductase|nr:NADPH:quinone oxidoreductase family protein [Anderseniella sp.]